MKKILSGIIGLPFLIVFGVFACAVNFLFTEEELRTL